MEKPTSFDMILSWVVLGMMAPIGLMLFFWWGSILCGLTNEQTIGILTVSGLLTGTIADATILRRHLGKLFALPISALIGIAGFYSLGIYGFSMGVPVLNVFVGSGMSYIVAKKRLYGKAKPEESEQEARLMEGISAGILFVACIGSALLALNEESIEDELQQMLRLSFTVTRGMIWILIVGGGLALLIFQYLLSKFVYRWVIRKAA
ncbi:MAG: hypothetical protein V1761_03905 [bacterium]